jgi:C-terminal processing protease CtpA/Prc
MGHRSRSWSHRNCRRIPAHVAVLVPILVCVPFLPAQESHLSEYGIGAVVVTGANPSCPVFIGSVFDHSPASRAGLKAGDRLISVDGHVVARVPDAMRQLGSDEPTPVVVAFEREEKTRIVAVQRVDRSTLMEEENFKLVDGNWVPANATYADIRYQLATEQALASFHGVNAVAFSDHHYPLDKQSYYPGFEVFIWNSKKRVTIGGIERGPAERAGFRWGDEIVGINGVDPHGKSTGDIESMLSRTKPAELTLSVTRGALTKTSSFALEQASAILTENQKKVTSGTIVPRWLPDQYLSCWQ